VDVKPAEAVASAVTGAPDALFVSSLGTATSALRLASGDGPHLYLGGAMGCGLAVALGVAEGRPGRAVVAVVGDGDLLMGAGSLWSLSGLRPSNLLVLVLDDGRYAITGGQDVIAPDALAAVVGVLPGVESALASSPSDVATAVRSVIRPGIVVARIDEPAWPGPSPFVDPPLVRRRFAAYASTQMSDGARTSDIHIPDIQSIPDERVSPRRGERQ
jgi:thiamine pyrophosphate-dependent acetolactate synthase large subunit-like protein